MNANFRRFEMLALGTMTGDALKDDISDATSLFSGVGWRFAFVGLCDGDQYCVEHQYCRDDN